MAGGRRRRARPPLALLTLVVVVALAVGGVLTLSDLGGEAARVPVVGNPAAAVPPPAPEPERPSPAAVSLDGGDAFRVRLKPSPRAGLLFDLDSGEVLWRLNPRSPLPIASVTKVMTALLVAERTDRRAQVLIRSNALFFEGQAVGNLPVGKKVPIEALLHGALLTSGNDAAIALADHVAGSERAFVKLMNERARELGLTCSHFVSPHGLEPANRSCPADLAVLTRLVMAKPRIAEVVRRQQTVQPFPIKDGKLYLTTTNPLLLSDYPGTIGLKTGFNTAAGNCFIAVVRRGGRTLAAVLLHSANPSGQARQLLERGFKDAKA